MDALYTLKLAPLGSFIPNGDFTSLVGALLVLF